MVDGSSKVTHRQGPPRFDERGFGGAKLRGIRLPRVDQEQRRDSRDGAVGQRRSRDGLQRERAGEPHLLGGCRTGDAESTSTAADHSLPTAAEQVMTRRLNDGSTYSVVKNFWSSDDLERAFATAGVEPTVRETPTYFQYGVGERR